MHKELLLTIAKRSVVLLTLPILLLAFSVGPDPRHTGAPGDQTCARSGCHTGTALNAGTGRVVLQLPGGMTYVPGQRQRIAVVITGDATTRRYGYQASARLGSNEANGQAGTFTATAPDIILCQSGNERPAAGCGSAAPLEFISHGNSSNTSGRFEFDWTAPATDVGPVKIYVSANAANGNGSDSGDKIYTTSVTLMPAAMGGGNRPAITSTGGVVNGASFSVGVVAGSWTTIFGSNFATALKTWDGLIDAQGNFPTAIDNVRVTIDGLPASMNFISANQINVQAPALTRTGMVPVVVTTPAGASEMVMANVQREAPGLFLFTQTPTRFPAAVRSPDGQFIAPAGLFPGVTTEPAKPGDIVLLFGTGFGPTDPAVAPGRVFSGAAPLTPVNAASLQVRIGGMTVVPSFAGLSGSGLYQFNVTVPNLPDGNHRIEMLLNGQQIQTDVQLAIKR